MAEACSSDHHLDHAILDDIFSMNVDDLFALIFSDSSFYRKFTDKRKTYDVKLGDWTKSDDGPGGRRVRNLQYVLSINHPIGPKTSHTKEVQTMHAESRPGEKYLVDAECHNGGIPYADNFYTTVRYCLRWSSENSTRMVVSCRVNFAKNVSSFAKIFIEKTAINGTKNSFNDFVHLLRLEINSLRPENFKDVTQRSGLRQRIKSKATASNGYEICRASTFLRPQIQQEQFDYAGCFLIILIAALLVISLMNAFIYMQLLAMENSLKRLVSSKTK